MVLTAGMPLHLEDHLDVATIEGSEVPADLPEPVEWRFDEPQPAWKPAASFSQSLVAPVRTGDALQVVFEEKHVDADGDFCGSLYTDVPDWRLQDWAYVALEARAQPGVQQAGRLGFNLTPPAAPFAQQALGRPFPLIADGTVRTYLPSPDPVLGKFDGVWRQLILWFCVSQPGLDSALNEHDLWALSLENGKELDVLAATPFPSAELGASFSPDGKWLAYASGDGRSLGIEVYVEPFPMTGEKHRISQERGVMPLWSPAGGELFYRPVTQSAGMRQTLKSIDVTTDATFQFSAERGLPLREFVSYSFYRSFDLTPDGQRFLVVLPADPAEYVDVEFRIQIVQNWHEELKRLVPAN